MGRSRVSGLFVRQRSLAYCFIAGLILLSGCVTTSTLPEMAWVRTDGRKIADDPALWLQGKSDIAACDSNLDSGTFLRTSFRLKEADVSWRAGRAVSPMG
jgi:hypothetical protein